MQINKKYILTSVLAATFASASATADISTENTYVGLGAGLASLGKDGVDDSVATRGFIGKTVNENLAVEVGYINFGQMDITGTDGYIEITGFEIAPVAVLPISMRVNLFLKAGFMAWEAGADEDGFDLFYAAGGEYLISQELSVRGAWESYTIDDLDISVLSANVIFKF